MRLKQAVRLRILPPNYLCPTFRHKTIETKQAFSLFMFSSYQAKETASFRWQRNWLSSFLFFKIFS